MERERKRERARLMERANRPRGRQELEYNRRQTSHPEYAFSYKPSSDQFGHYDRPPRPNQLWEYSRYSPERIFERRRSPGSPRELNFEPNLLILSKTLTFLCSYMFFYLLFLLFYYCSFFYHSIAQ